MYTVVSSVKNIRELNPDSRKKLELIVKNNNLFALRSMHIYGRYGPKTKNKAYLVMFC